MTPTLLLDLNDEYGIERLKVLCKWTATEREFALVLCDFMGVLLRSKFSP